MKYEIELSDEDAAELIEWATHADPVGTSRIGYRIAAQVREQRPKPIEVGCVVLHATTPGSEAGRVVAIHAGRAWVEWACGGIFPIQELDMLRRVGS